MQNKIMSIPAIGFVLLFFHVQVGLAQGSANSEKNATVYIDKQGLLRYTANNKEAAFFGVNYTTPFAYAYRAHKVLGADLEEAIRRDVYHFARLGFDAFRVHVWDTEISDTAGNLLENEHLRLFDFLLAELKKRKIKTIITPIAFWGNGYPERDENTPGFSRKYGKARATVNDTAIRAQENYLRQFFRHVNPYTKTTYHDDPDVIAMEINNEPSHSGPKAGVTGYINRLAAAVKSTGWIKPIFYNISQGPFYAGAVAASVAEGFSFQWYPSGLVSGRSLKGNFLPHVDRYNIPFDDTIAAFSQKALMVYEFDAADIAQSYMYPAMARSFRSAGFQWATQFAWDPMALAHANTEYQTHYLNLAYTPSKAISMLIACEVFHRVPRLKKYETYPGDSLFEGFRISYAASLSEMNTGEKFYYSNNTASQPVNASQLRHVAGVGNSKVIRYAGSGAYFLDKLEEGVWRLEVMPDAIPVRDPFERTSPERIVTAIQWNSNPMQIRLPDLGTSFTIKGLNEGNSFSGVSGTNGFSITPGSYILTRKGLSFSGNITALGVIGLREFVAPPATDRSVLIRHKPNATVLSNETDGELYNAGTNKNVFFYPGFRRGFQFTYVEGETPKSQVLRLAASQPDKKSILGFQHYAGEIRQAYGSSLPSFDTVIVRARSATGQPVRARLALITRNGVAFASSFIINENFSAITLPLSGFQRDSCLLLPRPYPGFQPMWFSAQGGPAKPVLQEVEKIEFLAGPGLSPGATNKAVEVEIEYVRLKERQ